MKDLIKNSIRADIAILVEVLKEIKWNPINELSINRIIFMTILTDKYLLLDGKNNFFQIYTETSPMDYYYKFTPDVSGPICSDINSIISKMLKKHELILENDNLYLTNQFDTSKLPFFKPKYAIFKTISDLLAYYGEFEIYDLIFCDVTFSSHYKRNDAIIKFDDNKTIKLLTNLKSKFDESIKNNLLTNYNYLQMYFDFVFAEIKKTKAVD